MERSRSAAPPSPPPDYTLLYRWSDRKGWIPFLSRILIDTETGEVLLDKQRLAETYFVFLLSNGWDQGFNIQNKQYTDIKNYLKKVYSPDRLEGLPKAVGYLLQSDFFGPDGSY